MPNTSSAGSLGGPESCSKDLVSVDQEGMSPSLPARRDLHAQHGFSSIWLRVFRQREHLLINHPWSPTRAKLRKSGSETRPAR